MIRVNASFIYQLGSKLNALRALTNQSNNIAAWNAATEAASILTVLSQQNVVSIRTSSQKLSEFMGSLNNFTNSFNQLQPSANDPCTNPLLPQIIYSASELEVLLTAELSQVDWYAVFRKGGFDTISLSEYGESLFPVTLQYKVGEAIPDAKSAARCIAFELPTAAAFHLHRINEIVLRRYYDAIRGDNEHPEHKTIEAYIQKMKTLHIGDKKVIGALASLKNFHRNPIIHPDESLHSVEEAIALLGSIRAVVTYMLESISPPPALPYDPTKHIPSGF